MFSPLPLHRSMVATRVDIFLVFAAMMFGRATMLQKIGVRAHPSRVKGVSRWPPWSSFTREPLCALMAGEVNVRIPSRKSKNRG
jgi:hypothetical protein